MGRKEATEMGKDKKMIEVNHVKKYMLKKPIMDILWQITHIHI